MIPALARLLHLGTPSPRRSSTSPASDYEQLPLSRNLERAHDDSDSNDDRPSPASSRSSKGPPTRRIPRWVLFVGGGILLWISLDYLYSDPERWDSTWNSYLTGPHSVRIGMTVRAAGEKWKGVEMSSKVVAFKRIPYAIPPTTPELRFRRPRRWVATERTEEEWERLVARDASEVDDGCPRPKTFIEDPGFIGDEDCLNLNIYTPSKQVPGVKLPVLVWIHGGGFYTGTPHEARTEPTDLIERSLRMNQPIVVINLGYRLNILGFSSSPPVSGPPPTPPHIPLSAPVDLDLNVGLKDQLEALEWIRREIHNFGGDCDKVTLVGHSAGAISVGLHQLYSPPELFRGAFMLSGAPTSFPIPFPHDAAARTLHPLPSAAGCPSPVHLPTSPPGSPPSNKLLLECLRTLSLPRLMETAKILFNQSPGNQRATGSKAGMFPWYPTLEGDWEGSWLDVRPSDRIVRGTFSKVPVVMGSVVDEGTRFVDRAIDSQAQIEFALRRAFDFTYGAIETILTPIFDFYPPSDSAGSPYHTGESLFGLQSAYKRASSLMGDIYFQAPRRHFLRETPKDFGEPSWNYLYVEPILGADPRLGVQHGADLGSWFGHPSAQEDDREMHGLARHMTAYLINFVANLDPNGPGLRIWPQYGMDRRTLHLGRRNISVGHDDDRLDAMRFLNVQNPIFAR